MVNDEGCLYKNIIGPVFIILCIALLNCISSVQPIAVDWYRKQKTGKTPIYKTSFSPYKKQSFASCLPFTGFPPLYPEVQEH